MDTSWQKHKLLGWGNKIEINNNKIGEKVLKRPFAGRWAQGIGWPPVPRVHSLLKSFQWKPAAMSTVGQGTMPKSPGWGLSDCHPLTLLQTRPFLSHTFPPVPQMEPAKANRWRRVIQDKNVTNEMVFNLHSKLFQWNVLIKCQRAHGHYCFSWCI